MAAAGVAFTLAVYVLAAAAEIGGCFAFWAWLRGGGSPLWLVPGAACLAAFAWLLTRIDTAFAGRAFAAYGGIYIVASLFWLVLAEGAGLSRWDVLGAALCLVGTAVILFGSRLA